jgi:hypothetical protein
VAKVKVTLVQASPKTLVRGQVRDLASVAKNKTVLDLPGSFSFLRI